jgi:hypothetical protein
MMVHPLPAACSRLNICCAQLSGVLQVCCSALASAPLRMAAAAVSGHHQDAKAPCGIMAEHGKQHVG